MKTVILCGGRGTRLREHTERIPKPLVEVGDKPILWHIMKIYSHYGFKDFVLCLGYKGDLIKQYFMESSDWKGKDFTLSSRDDKVLIHTDEEADWNITFANTGPDTNTGGRIKKIEKYINDDNFFMTYGDGLSNIDINELLEYHKKMGKIATVTSVRPRNPFGLLYTDGNGIVAAYEEKPVMEQQINGGFFVFRKDVFDYLEENDVLEKESMNRLIGKRQLCSYKFDGYWACMDTYKDTQI